MKAVIIRGYGGPDVIELADVPVPQPATGQVRIRVHAAPVHPVDIATRAGGLAEHGLMAASGMLLASRGVEYRLARNRDGRIGVDEIASVVDARTRIVAVSWVA